MKWGTYSTPQILYKLGFRLTANWQQYDSHSIRTAIQKAAIKTSSFKQKIKIKLRNGSSRILCRLANLRVFERTAVVYNLRQKKLTPHWFINFIYLFLCRAKEAAEEASGVYSCQILTQRRPCENLQNQLRQGKNFRIRTKMNSDFKPILNAVSFYSTQLLENIH